MPKTTDVMGETILGEQVRGTWGYSDDTEYSLMFSTDLIT